MARKQTKKQKVSAQDIVTAMLKAEVEAREKKEAVEKPDRARRRKAPVKKATPPPVVEAKPVSAAMERKRKMDYKLIAKVWKNPASANLRPDGVVGYIKGIAQVERKSKDPDIEHVQDLLYLAALWQVRIAES